MPWVAQGELLQLGSAGVWWGHRPWWEEIASGQPYSPFCCLKGWPLTTLCQQLTAKPAQRWFHGPHLYFWSESAPVCFQLQLGKKLCPLLGLQRSGGFKSSTKRLSTQKGTTNFYLLWTSKQLPVSIKAPKPASVKFQQCEITVCVTAVFALGTQPAPELHIPATSALLFPGLCPWMQRWSF